MPTLLRTNKEIMEIYDRQVDTVYRVCYAYMKNAPEAEDMTQETFLRLMSNGKPFADQRHEKGVAHYHGVKPLQGHPEKVVAKK